MTTHPFLPSYLDRSECEQCGQPEDYPQHREQEPEPREAIDWYLFREPSTPSGYFQAQGIRTTKDT